MSTTRSTTQSILDRIDEQIASLKHDIELNHGKRGNAERRAQLDALVAKRWTAFSHTSDAHKKINGQNLDGPRSDHSIERKRALINAVAQCNIVRGSYSELDVSNPHTDEHYYSSEIAQVMTLTTHPALRQFAAWREANDVLQRAVDFGLLDEAGIEDAGSSRRRNRWQAVNHDIYSYTHDGKLICVQQRESESDGRYTNVKIRYFVTDGETAVEILNGRKQIVKRAAKADPAPDSPLRALRNDLPAEWQELIDPAPVKFAAVKIELSGTGYKLLEQREDGALASLWKSDYTYRIGALRSQHVEEDHGGGLYYYLTRDECKKLTAGNWGRTIRRFAVVRCEVGGRTLEYPSGKRASTYLRPVEIVETIEA